MPGSAHRAQGPDRSAGAATGVRGEVPHGWSGGVIWLTGLSGSGKSTIARALEAELRQLGCRTCILEGDEIRRGLCRDLGFSESDRHENIRRISEVAHRVAGSGAIVIAAVISPYRHDRALARIAMAGLPFTEVHLSTSLAECERRDPKGLYRRARAGEIRNLTGIDHPYEEPREAELSIDTAACTVEAATDRILSHLQDLGIVTSDPSARVLPG